MPSSRTVRCFPALVVAAATHALCPSARAAPFPERSAAEMLDSEGTALMQERRYAEACPKLAESNRLAPGTGVLLRLGLCDEQIGKTASAWSVFREAAARAQRSGDEGIRQLATKRADELAPRVPRVIFMLVPGTRREAIALTCDGGPLDRAALGAELPMDPGPHTVEVARAGRSVFRKTFTLAPRDTPVSVAIELPAAETRAPSAESVARERAPSSGTRTQRSLALVSGGVGIAGVAAGSIFGLVAISDWNRARGGCASGVTGCNQDALNLQSVVKSDATWSTIGFVVGAAGLLGAALLWWTAPKSDDARVHAGPTFRPVLGADRLGVDLEGSF